MNEGGCVCLVHKKQQPIEKLREILKSNYGFQQEYHSELQTKISISLPLLNEDDTQKIIQKRNKSSVNQIEPIISFAIKGSEIFHRVCWQIDITLYIPKFYQLKKENNLTVNYKTGVHYSILFYVVKSVSQTTQANGHHLVYGIIISEHIRLSRFS